MVATFNVFGTCLSLRMYVLCVIACRMDTNKTFHGRQRSVGLLPFDSFFSTLFLLASAIVFDKIAVQLEGYWNADVWVEW